jgi:hydroxymethylpyrimidine pyrophosphatase-like HAD family hydrolase
MRARTSTKKPKLVAVDLDGTLLDGLGNPHPRDLKALRALQSVGVIVTIITGRLYSGTRRSAEAIGIKGPVGCVDGSHVVSTETHKTLYHRSFIKEHAELVRTSFEKAGPATFLFANDTIVHDKHGDPFLDYVSTWSTDVVRAQSVVDHPLWQHDLGVTAVVAVGTMPQIMSAAKHIEESVGLGAQVATFPTRPLRHRDAGWGMLVRAAGGNKGSALEWIANHHGVSIEETVAIGDWINDVPMLQTAGRSFAMGQAPDTVRDAATDLLSETALEGGGITSALEAAFGTKFP